MIYIASDHAGFELKEDIKNYLQDNKIEYADLGTDSEKSVDYPDYAFKVAKEVNNTAGSLGILICGTGIGMGIAANKIKGIRAALIYDEYTAEVARKHNNANIITLGGRTMTPLEARRYITKFISSEYEGGRHDKRITKIENAEK